MEDLITKTIQIRRFVENESDKITFAVWIKNLKYETLSLHPSKDAAFKDVFRWAESCTCGSFVIRYIDKEHVNQTKQ